MLNMKKLLTTILLLSLVSPVALGQSSHEDILHLHCVLDPPKLESDILDMFIVSVLFEFNTKYGTYNSLRFRRPEDWVSGNSINPNILRNLERYKSRIDNISRDHPPFTSSYGKYVMTHTTSMRGETRTVKTEIDRTDGTLTFTSRNNIPSINLNDYSAKCTPLSHAEAVAVYDDAIAAIKAYETERPPQLF